MEDGRLRGLPIIVGDNSKVLKLDNRHPGIIGASNKQPCSLNDAGSNFEFPSVAVTCGKVKTVVTISQDGFIQDTDQLPLSSGVKVVPFSNGNHIKIIATQSDGVSTELNIYMN